jgi:hypothetical protein
MDTGQLTAAERLRKALQLQNTTEDVLAHASMESEFKF